ncbi:MAG: nitroreductase family protein [Oscillospiraceae bacterium]|nr:nitroreductase family protein [Oscillospiraceae bacterium]
MDAIQTIMSRRSVRQFTDQPITPEQLQVILDAATSGPSCVYAQDWDFIVVRDRAMLNRMADGNGRPAEPLRSCNVGILICGNLERAFPPAQDYWIIDGAIAGQNLVLAAAAQGIGSVWLGTYPQMERVENQRALFGLPEHIVPHSLIALGYPAEEEPRAKKPLPDCIHYEHW